MPEINTGPEHILFDQNTTRVLASVREPELWHEIVFSINHDTMYAYEILEWIVEQPECDIATAYAVLATTAGHLCIYEKTHDIEIFELSEIIIQRAQDGLYTRSLIGLDRVYLPPSKMAKEIEEGCMKLPDSEQTKLPVPTVLLEHTYPETGRFFTGYMGDETGIWHIKSTQPEKDWHYYAAYLEA